ncbi:hypothetical protein F4805DRAFT_438037 [Annulohypoxylon moriforme]|nr:hypothetical protein F4805DRAFT_438037 [Annulohypoxylon moriforme]
MEAVGVGANVLAFVLLALKSAKTSYETISAIKDGPEIVRQVAANINQFYWILYGLRNSPAAIDDSLMGHLKTCCEQLNSAASFIEKLQISPSERRAGRFWRRLKAFLGEKDLDQLNVQLTMNIGILNLKLQDISSNILHDLKRHYIQTERSIERLSDTIQTQAHVQETSFSDLRESLCGEISTQSESIRTRLNTVCEDVAARPAMSQSQGDCMLGLLQEIKGLLTSSPNKYSTSVAESTGDTSATPSSSQPSSNHGVGIDDDDGLIQNIDRLCGLINDKQRIINTYANDDEESDGIIEDLQTILRSAWQQGELVEPRIIPEEDEVREFKRISKQFQRGFGQYGIAINQGVVNQKPPHYSITKQTYTRQKRRMKSGTLTLSLKHLTRSSRGLDSSQDIEGKSYSDYSITLTFFPKDPLISHMLVASTFQYEIERGVASSISRLDVNRVVPSTSRAFKVVRQENLRELRRMLQYGEASLRDHDEGGASLLFYSTK